MQPSGGTPPYTFSYTPGATPFPGFQVLNAPDVPSWFPPGVAGIIGNPLPGKATNTPFTNSIRLIDCAGTILDKSVTFSVWGADYGFEYLAQPWLGHEMGITNGCGIRLFCPNSNVTRAQMAVFIIRMRYGTTANFDYPSTPYFMDVGPTTFGWNWIQRMKEDNITSGCTLTTYCPDNPLIRGDMAIFIMRGGFNQLLSPTEPILVSIDPATIPQGATGTFTIIGAGTNFVQGVSTIAPVPGITVGTVTVTSPTALTVQLTAASGAVTQPLSVVAITGPPPGNEKAVLPNGLVIQ